MRERRKNSIPDLTALLLLVLFAAGILSVLFTGAHVYKGVAARDAASYDRRTCAQYLANKVRQASAPDSVLVSEFGDGDSLVICQRVGGEECRTQIYCHDGWMMELFTASVSGFEPEDGEKIVPMETFTVTSSGNVLRMKIVDGEGKEESIVLTLRGGRWDSHEE